MSQDDDTKEQILKALKSGKPTKETLSEKPALAQSLFQSIAILQDGEKPIKRLAHSDDSKDKI